MSGLVTIEREGALAWIIFDYEKRRNAITADMWEAIPPLAEQVDRDPEIRVAIMRGAGDVAFVSGADISEFDGRRTGAGASHYEQLNIRAFEALAGITKPTIAMIHGFCMGGGCALAVTADLRCAADDARFGIPAGRLGVGYPPGGLETLVQTVGFPAAKEILLTAETFDAPEAQRLGFVNRVFSKARLEERTREIANAIAQNAPLTMRAAKVTFANLAHPADRRDPDAVRTAVQACFESADYQEGVSAFLEGRRPQFEGR